jgi:hypothetical protein
VRALLWILAGVVLLDAALVAVVAICAAVVRRRGPRAVRDPVTWWPMETEREAGRQGRGVVVVPIRSGEAVVPAVGESRRPRHRTLAVALVAATVFAGTAFASSPQIRRFVATAIGTVTGTTQTEAAGQDTEGQPAAGDPSDQPGVAGSGARSPSPDGTTDPSPGPVVEPRPPGVPHGGVLAPTAPSSLTANASSSSQVDLVWGDVDGENGFRVERSSDGAGGWSAVAETGPGGTSWSDGGLSQGTTYYYRVVATNVAGDSPPSNVASATTSIDPASPTTVTAIASSPTQIDLEWTDVANETGYRLERSDGSSRRDDRPGRDLLLRHRPHARHHVLLPGVRDERGRGLTGVGRRLGDDPHGPRAGRGGPNVLAGPARHGGRRSRSGGLDGLVSVARGVIS